MDAFRAAIRQLLPLPIRLALRRAPAIALHPWLPRPARASDRLAFPHLQAERRTPLRRPGTTYGAAWQRAKEVNVARAAELLDGVVVAPGACFSWHRCIGPPVFWRGFMPGPELRGGRLEAGDGGGLCQAANLVHWLALHAGMNVVERHRHPIDLFPDHDRTAPFGSGATVLYPHRNLRFLNPLDQSVLFELEIAAGHLVGRAKLERDPEARWELVERDARFLRESGQVLRCNRLLRRRVGPDGTFEELVAVNRATVAYPVEEGSE